MCTLHLALAACLFGASACSASMNEPHSVAASAACERLGNTSQTVSSMFAEHEIYGAAPAAEHIVVGASGLKERQVGAELFVHATPGTTGQYLQRTLECYTAYDNSVHPNDPFHPSAGRVADVSVRPAGDSFAVRIVGNSPEAARDIWSRAQALTSSTVQVEQVGELNYTPNHI